jgi:hypothetical protein
MVGRGARTRDLFGWRSGLKTTRPRDLDALWSTCHAHYRHITALIKDQNEKINPSDGGPLLPSCLPSCLLLGFGRAPLYSKITRPKNTCYCEFGEIELSPTVHTSNTSRKNLTQKVKTSAEAQCEALNGDVVRTFFRGRDFLRATWKSVPNEIKPWPKARIRLRAPDRRLRFARRPLFIKRLTQRLGALTKP